jgi:hypothetical protein
MHVSCGVVVFITRGEHHPARRMFCEIAMEFLDVTEFLRGMLHILRGGGRCFFSTRSTANL